MANEACVLFSLRSSPFGKMTGHSLLCLLRGCRKGKSIRTQGTMGREKERERDLSSLPIVHRALIYIFVIFVLLEYPAGASKEEKGWGKLKFIFHLVTLTSY